MELLVRQYGTSHHTIPYHTIPERGVHSRPRRVHLCHCNSRDLKNIVVTLLIERTLESMTNFYTFLVMFSSLYLAGTLTSRLVRSMVVVPTTNSPSFAPPWISPIRVGSPVIATKFSLLFSFSPCQSLICVLVSQTKTKLRISHFSVSLTVNLKSALFLTFLIGSRKNTGWLLRQISMRNRSSWTC